MILEFERLCWSITESLHMLRQNVKIPVVVKLGMHLARGL